MHLKKHKDSFLINKGHNHQKCEKNDEASETFLNGLITVHIAVLEKESELPVGETE